MQQSSATQSLHLSFWGLRKIVACSHSSSQCLLVSTVFGTVSSLHPTSFLMIFILVHICVIPSPLEYNMYRLTYRRRGDTGYVRGRLLYRTRAEPECGIV